MRRVLFTVVAVALPALVLGACSTSSPNPPPLGDCDGPCYLVPKLDAAVAKDVSASETGAPDASSADAHADTGADASAGDGSTDAGSDASDAALD